MKTMMEAEASEIKVAFLESANSFTSLSFMKLVPMDMEVCLQYPRNLVKHELSFVFVRDYLDRYYSQC